IALCVKLRSLRIEVTLPLFGRLHGSCGRNLAELLQNSATCSFPLSVGVAHLFKVFDFRLKAAALTLPLKFPILSRLLQTQLHLLAYRQSEARRIVCLFHGLQCRALQRIDLRLESRTFGFPSSL